MADILITVAKNLLSARSDNALDCHAALPVTRYKISLNMGRYWIEFTLFFHYNYNIMTRCFTMLKPGVVNRRLVGEVIERLEKKGFKLVGLKMMQVSNELACSHYAEHKEKPFFGELVDYVTSGPVVAMVWQADDCVALMRKMCGATKPSEAMPGTIRGDYCSHTSHNIIHASDSDESAAREIALWFNENELIDWDDCCGEKWY